MASCASCGSCGGTDLMDDARSGDTVCTTCGLVTGRENSLQVSYDYSGEIAVSPAVSITIVRVVRALELEPASDWIEFVHQQANTSSAKPRRMTQRRVCEILLREDGHLYERMRALGFEKIRRPQQSSTEQGQGQQGSTTNNTAIIRDDYGHWIRRSGLCETRDEIRALNLACQQTVDRVPELRFVLPPLFVVAVYANMVSADKQTLARIVSDTQTHPQSVKRIMKKIKT